VVRAFAQPGHWLGPVTGPGWLGLAQPKKIKKIGNKKYKNIYKKKYACIYLNLNLFGLFKELESTTPFIFVLGYVILINAIVGSIRS
jgi:hypothetical protein